MSILFEVLYPNDHFLTEEMLWEMARVKPADSGLPQTIFISTRDYVDKRHWARIKVSNIIGTFSSTDNFVVEISKNPKILAGNCKLKKDELQDIFDWVVLNYDALIKYWNDEYESDSEIYNDLKKI
jgi:hypothetical protein